MSARQRYDALSGYRSQYLTTAVRCSELTLPYLIREDDDSGKNSRAVLVTPWQSVGSKGVTALASKLMLALLPPQFSFFKLQLDDSQLELPPEVLSELDQSFAKIERVIMEDIAASTDRVIIHQAMRHLVVGGNGLIFMGKDALKFYPLNRYVIDRDGNDNLIELVTKERISKKLLEGLIPEDKFSKMIQSDPDQVSNDECDIYTHVQRVGKFHVWHQEAEGAIIKGSKGKAPIDRSPWLPLRFNTVDGGESYGRGRVEEFLGDLISLDSLMKSLVEAASVSSKVVFLLNPGSSTKPATVTAAKSGDVIPGKEGDLTAVQVNKALDLQTAEKMVASLEARILEAFLVLRPRHSERTTAGEVRMSQMELELQQGGLFSLLTVDLLVPYLRRRLDILQKSKRIPEIPQDIVKPAIVAGINALGRGQDWDSLTQLTAALAQSLGPESIQQLLNPIELVKRLVAARGIDALNLIKTPQDIQAQKQEQIETQKDLSLTDQTAALASAPVNDPSKNPELTNGNQQTDQAGAGQANPAGPKAPQ
jgi:hypothetical protein